MCDGQPCPGGCNLCSNVYELASDGKARKNEDRGFYPPSGTSHREDSAMPDYDDPIYQGWE